MLLLKDYELNALCLQKTHLRDTDVSIRDYIAFHTFSAKKREPQVVFLSLTIIMLLIIIYFYIQIYKLLQLA